GTARVAFSTRAEHAAHVMPVTSNVCFTSYSFAAALPFARTDVSRETSATNGRTALSFSAG
ncbi:MAG: hypothetical protein ACLUYK_09360, partial [Eggerthella lenta]